jgi:hypothetical protein
MFLASDYVPAILGLFIAAQGALVVGAAIIMFAVLLTNLIGEKEP